MGQENEDRTLPATEDKGPVTSRPLTVNQLKAYPESARTIALPQPTKEGHILAGKSHGRSFKLHYKLYGGGPTKILFLAGHGDQIRSWHRLVSRFCVPTGDKYSSLFIQQRGVKESEGPFGLWSMKDLAQDALDLLNGLDWTMDRSVHVVGGSMGGMQAQRLALLCPSRIASLTLVSTTSHWLANLSLAKCTRDILSSFIPQSEDQQLAKVLNTFFGKAWPTEHDAEGAFPTNGDNWAARDYLDADISYWGAVLQAPACVGHRVDSSGLARLAQEVGGSRIQVIHGRADNIVPFEAGVKLFEGLGGKEAGVHFHCLEDTGHIPCVERLPEFVALLESLITLTT